MPPVWQERHLMYIFQQKQPVTTQLFTIISVEMITSSCEGGKPLRKWSKIWEMKNVFMSTVIAPVSGVQLWRTSSFQNTAENSFYRRKDDATKSLHWDVCTLLTTKALFPLALHGVLTSLIFWFQSQQKIRRGIQCADMCLVGRNES